MTPLSILFLTTVLPGAQGSRSGGEVVTSQVIAALRDLGHSVLVLGYGRPDYQPTEGEMLTERRHIETHNAPLHAALWFARAFLRGCAYSIEKYKSRTYCEALADMLRERRWDRVILDHAQTGWLLPMLSKEFVVHLSHNSEAQLYTKQATSGNVLRRLAFKREARLIHHSERTLARTSQSLWTLTQENANYFRELGAASPTVLPIPPMPLPEGFRPGKSEYDVGLLGTWSWGPNRAGLDWFCNKILPLLPSNVKIAVAGIGAEDLNDRFSNLSIFGRVANAAEFLGKARCIAVPSVAGDGIQIKTLDAIAIGRPVVATNHALRGIDGAPSRVHIADRPEEFASALCEAVARPEGTTQDAWAAERIEYFRKVLKDALA